MIGVKDLVGTQKSAAAAAAAVIIVVLAVVLYASIVRMFLASWEFLLPARKGGFMLFFAFRTHNVLHKIGGGDLTI